VARSSCASIVRQSQQDAFFANIAKQGAIAGLVVGFVHEETAKHYVIVQGEIRNRLAGAFDF
jgi:hypothetical protein